MIEQHTQEQAAPSEAFVEQVKKALEHLSDFAYLQHHPLAQEWEPSAGRLAEMPGQWLRRELIAAIETLNPGPSVPFRAPHARLYNLLLLHYVERMTVQEAARELGISRRQAHRDLRRGEESVAEVLWSRRPLSLPPEPRATHLSSVQAEMARLEIHPCPTDVRLLLQHAQEAVERQATQRGILFQAGGTQEPLVISTDPVMARQVLVDALSHAVRQAQPGTLHLALTAEEEQTSLTLHYIPESQATNTPAVSNVVAQLAERLGWMVMQSDEAGGIRTVSLRMTARCPTVLAIDDNEGLVELLDDYLTGHACRVVAAFSGREGLQLAQETLPDAIVLDVMMPEMDGWELLQRLRTHPHTANVPVIICSVINNPELAYSLGASLFLPKPVSRDDVLKALRQLGVV